MQLVLMNINFYFFQTHLNIKTKSSWNPYSLVQLFFLVYYWKTIINLRLFTTLCRQNSAALKCRIMQKTNVFTISKSCQKIKNKMLQKENLIMDHQKKRFQEFLRIIGDLWWFLCERKRKLLVPVSLKAPQTPFFFLQLPKTVDCIIIRLFSTFSVAISNLLTLLSRWETDFKMTCIWRDKSNTVKKEERLQKGFL